MLSAVFIKGTIRITLDKQRFEFLQQNISQFGVSGLSWGELNATEHFGARVQVEVDFPVGDGFSFKCPGQITREYTATTEAMGIRFELTPELRSQIAEYVKKYGYNPSEFLRKYPRIPANSMIQTFPTHALVMIIAEDTVAMANEQLMVMDVVNLSPNGAMLATENQMALMMQPGERILVTLQPRGWFPTQIRIQAMICRVIDDMREDNGNLRRSMGIKFLKMDDLNRTAFLDLLKDILEQIKKYPSE